ncbi:hypothetical protein LWF01_07590 [Saxibacter everestensis]|uniref:CsbD family protein n=1 Tax=Saxibacter everestensis TaxID=2909229 RepID=A0ABY8QZJ8_9MICO|nr:hypothetical protein LWF01_07590 [Brevibacteriaceae bacterium ZFBP1038]
MDTSQNDPGTPEPEEPLEPSKIYRGKSGSGPQLPDSVDEILGNIRGSVASGLGKARSGIRNAANDGGSLDSASERINESLDSLGKKINGALGHDNVEGTIDSVQERINKILGGTKEKIGEAVDEDKVGEALDSTQERVAAAFEALKKRMQ